MAAAQLRPAPTGILLLPCSRVASRELGPLAWLVLEEFALEAEAGGTLAVETSVRALAAEFGVGKEAAATALGRLVDFGLIRCETRRVACRYAGSSYILDPDACRRAGVVITTDPTVDSPCPETPCPVSRDTAKRDTANAAAERTELLSRSAASRRTRQRVERSVAEQRDATARSLFDFSDQPSPSPTPNPLTLTTPVPATSPSPPTSQPDRPSSSLLPLTPSSQPDALAPGVGL